MSRKKKVKRKKKVQKKKKSTRMSNEKRMKIMNKVNDMLNKEKLHGYDRIAMLEMLKMHTIIHTLRK